MAGRYQPYESYKPSEIAWVKNIPAHWGRSKIGFESSVKARLGWKGLKAEEYVEDGYVFLATPNIKNAGIDFENVNYITEERYLESPEIMLQQGDVLVTKDGSTTGTTNVVRQMTRPATVNSSIAVLRPRKNIDSLYLFYFFTSEFTQNVIKMMQGGMGVPHLFQADMRWFDLILPPINEQRSIANFLDHETAKIDTLIDKQQQLIKLLKEKRQAVISHAVTKGLNPATPMKDSGVEWLGEVPEHWDVAMLKYFWTVLDCKHVTAEFVDEGIPLASIKEVKSWIVDLSDAKKTTEKYYELLVEGNRKPQFGDIIYSRNATVGEAALVPEDIKFAMGQDVCLLKKQTKFNSEYFLHQLNSPAVKLQLESLLIGSTFKRINVEEIRNYWVVNPPIEEQDEIAAFLQSKSNRYDQLIKKAETAIILMQERRTALISAAVTGKIDVRNWQPAQTEIPMEASA